MPARRKSLEALELSGQMKAKPGRYRDRLNQPASTNGIGRPPTHFNPEQRSIWREIVRAVPTGILTPADRIVVELGVALIGRLRSGAVTKTSEMGVLLSTLARLGLTPADRSKIDVPPPPKPRDAWDDLIEGKF